MRKSTASIIGGVIGSVIGGGLIGHKYCAKLMAARQLADKHLTMIRLYDIWMMTKQNGRSVSEYLMEKGIHEVAIYGMSYMGIRLFHELKDSLICVKFGIDCSLKTRIKGLDVYHLDEIKDSDVDAVIVTAFFAFDSIKKNLENLNFHNVIALDEIFYDLV